MTEDLWLNTTAKRCKRLVDSIPRHIKQCILARGKAFSKY